MQIEKLPLGELQANCYLLADEDTNKCLIIDPGDEANFISEKILRQDLVPVAIVATHGHFDHILATSELQMAFNIPFMIHPDDKKILNYMADSAQHWLNREIIEKPPKISKYLKNGDEIEFGQSSLSVIHTPGHSPGGICLYNTDEKIILTGDTLFSNGIGRTDFSYASVQQMQQSLKKLRERFFGFTAYPGHGGKFII